MKHHETSLQYGNNLDLGQRPIWGQYSRASTRARCMVWPGTKNIKQLDTLNQSGQSLGSLGWDMLWLLSSSSSAKSCVGSGFGAVSSAGLKRLIGSPGSPLAIWKRWNMLEPLWDRLSLTYFNMSELELNRFQHVSSACFKMFQDVSRCFSKSSSKKVHAIRLASCNTAQNRQWTNRLVRVKFWPLTSLVKCFGTPDA